MTPYLGSSPEGWEVGIPPVHDQQFLQLWEGLSVGGRLSSGSLEVWSP